MSVNFPRQPNGQQVTGQDQNALQNKPSVKSLASMLSRTLPQVNNNNTNNQLPQPIAIDINSLPPPMNAPFNTDLPPDDLPPVFPGDLPMPIVVEDTNAKGLDIILPKPLNALPRPFPSIVISSPSNVQKTEVKHSNKVNSSPVFPTAGVDLSEAAGKMKALRDRLDQNAISHTNYTDKDQSQKIIDEARKQGFTYNSELECFINKNNDIKTWKDFESNSVEDDEAIAQNLLAQFKLETKEAKEKEEAANLALAQQLEEEEKASLIQKTNNNNDQKPVCCLSDDDIALLKDMGWKLDMQGMYGIDASGDFMTFEDIKNSFGL